jgi:hypothetical protein
LVCHEQAVGSELGLVEPAEGVGVWLRKDSRDPKAEQILVAYTRRGTVAYATSTADGA